MKLLIPSALALAALGAASLLSGSEEKREALVAAPQVFTDASLHTQIDSSDSSMREVAIVPLSEIVTAEQPKLTSHDISRVASTLLANPDIHGVTDMLSTLLGTYTPEMTADFSELDHTYFDFAIDSASSVSYVALTGDPPEHDFYFRSKNFPTLPYSSLESMKLSLHLGSDGGLERVVLDPVIEPHGDHDYNNAMDYYAQARGQPLASRVVLERNKTGDFTTTVYPLGIQKVSGDGEEILSFTIGVLDPEAFPSQTFGNSYQSMAKIRTVAKLLNSQ